MRNQKRATKKKYTIWKMLKYFAVANVIAGLFAYTRLLDYLEELSASVIIILLVIGVVMIQREQKLDRDVYEDE